MRKSEILFRLTFLSFFLFSFFFSFVLFFFFSFSSFVVDLRRIVSRELCVCEKGWNSEFGDN